MTAERNFSTKNNLAQLTNIVVLMFENHSFDNILGSLYPPGYQSNGHTFEGIKPNTVPSEILPWTEPETDGKPDWSSEAITSPNPDPGERFQNVNMQLYGTTFEPGKRPAKVPTMDGFVSNYTLKKPTGLIESGLHFKTGDWPKLPRTRFWSSVKSPGVGDDAVGKDIMHYFSSAQLPVSSQLAKQYAVCDQWFCSVPTQTYPNRMYSLCATTWSKKLFCKYKEYIDDYDMAFLHSKNNSIFQVLDSQLPKNKNKPNWKVYHDSYSISRGLLHYLHDTKKDQVVNYCTDFKSDVKNGTLPPFSIVEPRYDLGNDFLGDNPNSYHPPYSVLEGEQLLQEVYETLFTSGINSKSESTLLIVTFDEHGGCYDHFPPPQAPLPNAPKFGKVPANFSGPPFDRYGVRVPTILISSQIKPGTIFRKTNSVKGQPTAHLDHTSIIRTVFDWQLPNTDSPVYMTNRDRCAPNVADVLTEAQGTNQGVDFSTIKWPPPISYSKDEKKALEEQNHLAQMRKAEDGQGFLDKIKRLIRHKKSSKGKK